METTQILLIEDEENLGATLVQRLSAHFRVDWAQSCQAAWARLEAQAYDLLLIDVGLPDGSGFDLAADISQRLPAPPAFVFLTAWSGPEQRVRGLELGAEDYIIKPFQFQELILRLRNALRRRPANQPGGAAHMVELGAARFDLTAYEVTVAGQTLPLGEKEAAVLTALLQRRGQVVSRDEILDRAWPEGSYPSPRTVDNFILRLRKYVEDDPARPVWIQNQRGVGYKLRDAA
jgi:DNA-binding response OmpR family regulator